ncbi:hypothetical protein Hanom_Chr06g00548481 [Helianthus anomalus]
MWFKSSVFRELQAHDKGFTDFCDECQSQKSARRNEWVAAKKKVEEMLLLESLSKDYYESCLFSPCCFYGSNVVCYYDGMLLEHRMFAFCDFLYDGMLFVGK